MRCVRMTSPPPLPTPCVALHGLACARPGPPGNLYSHERVVRMPVLSPSPPGQFQKGGIVAVVS